MSCCQVWKKRNQLPQPSGRRPYGWRLRPVKSSHAVSPAHLRPTYFMYVVSPAHQEKEKKGRVDVLGSLSKPMHTRSNNLLRHVLKKRVHNNMFFMCMTTKMYALYSHVVLFSRDVMQHFIMRYIPSPHAHQKCESTVFHIMHNMQIFNNYISGHHFLKGVKDCIRKILQQFSLAYVPPPHAHQYRKGTVFDAYNNMQIFHAYSIPKILPAFNIGFILAYMCGVFI